MAERSQKGDRFMLYVSQGLRVSKVLNHRSPSLPDQGVGGENCVEGVLTVRQAVAALGRGLEKGLGHLKLYRTGLFVVKRICKVHGSPWVTH